MVEQLKIALVSSLPPVTCGVADYTHILRNHLEARGHTVEVITCNVWGIAAGISIYRSLKKKTPDVVHFQYPSLAYGSGLGLHIAAFFSRVWPTVVTLHEFSQVRVPRQIAVLPFTLIARHLIFTSEYEKNIMTKIAPWIDNRSSIVGIGSNVPEPEKEIYRELKTIGYFGTIRPKKGLEQFIQLAEIMLKHDPSWCFYIVGVTPAKDMRYMQELRRQSSRLPNMTWKTDMLMPEVVKTLSSLCYAYLPFPDGASERRGSLLAMMKCGLHIITTCGPHTPAGLSSAVLFAETPALALREIIRLEKSSKLRYAMQEGTQRYLENYSWPRIAERHELIYSKLIK